MEGTPEGTTPEALARRFRNMCALYSALSALWAVILSTSPAWWRLGILGVMVAGAVYFGVQARRAAARARREREDGVAG
ncbi:hypothetical protein NBM05_01305 [Rothia sp. AR01]|uniref:Uncharacterized protein n=1 Tax=Rothia santali TaxID=2949643 RepID=A0A9X2KHB5_9MICC|nr:hypothetical protein [Rothia santali]MCP3424705.1 hypothetical protein [Rothia santali]